MISACSVLLGSSFKERRLLKYLGWIFKYSIIRTTQDSQESSDESDNIALMLISSWILQKGIWRKLYKAELIKMEIADTTRLQKTMS